MLVETSKLLLVLRQASSLVKPTALLPEHRYISIITVENEAFIVAENDEFQYVAFIAATTESIKLSFDPKTIIALLDKGHKQTAIRILDMEIQFVCGSISGKTTSYQCAHNIIPVPHPETDVSILNTTNFNRFFQFAGSSLVNIIGRPDLSHARFRVEANQIILYSASTKQLVILPQSSDNTDAKPTDLFFHISVCQFLDKYSESNIEIYYNNANAFILTNYFRIVVCRYPIKIPKYANAIPTGDATSFQIDVNTLLQTIKRANKAKSIGVVFTTLGPILHVRGLSKDNIEVFSQPIILAKPLSGTLTSLKFGLDIKLLINLLQPFDSDDIITIWFNNLLVPIAFTSKIYPKYYATMMQMRL